MACVLQISRSRLPDMMARATPTDWNDIVGHLFLVQNLLDASGLQSIIVLARFDRLVAVSKACEESEGAVLTHGGRFITHPNRSIKTMGNPRLSICGMAPDHI